MASFITSKYEIEHKIKETKNRLYDQLQRLVEAKTEEYRDHSKIKVKIGFSNLDYY